MILSIENHCSIVQQKKMAQYLTEILGDKLDLSSVHNDDSTKLPSPASLKGKILVKVNPCFMCPFPPFVCGDDDDFCLVITVPKFKSFHKKQPLGNCYLRF